MKVMEEKGIKSRVVLSRLAPEHVELIMSLEKDCFEHTWQRDSLLRDMGNSVSLYMGAWLNGRLVGFMAGWHIVGELHINTVAVNPVFRGIGLGKALVYGMLSILLKEGCQYSTLEVSFKNTPAIRLYENFGFNVLGEREDYYGPGDKALIMWTGDMARPEYTSLLENIGKDLDKRLCLSLE